MGLRKVLGGALVVVAFPVVWLIVRTVTHREQAEADRLEREQAIAAIEAVQGQVVAANEVGTSAQTAIRVPSLSLVVNKDYVKKWVSVQAAIDRVEGSVIFLKAGREATITCKQSEGTPVNSYYRPDLLLRVRGLVASREPRGGRYRDVVLDPCKPEH